MYYRIAVLLLLFLGLTVSCIQENPDLVNPPDKTASIKFRFFNLSLDKKSKVFEITEGKKTSSTVWGAISPTDNPPADTGFVRVWSDNNIEYEQNMLVRFLRNTNYTYVGLSSKVCEDRSNCKIDTLIALRTTSAIPENNYESLLKFMNAYPDTTLRFSLRLGCPSGDLLFGPTNYKQYSISPVTVRSGAFNFSVIKTEIVNGKQQEVSLNLFSATLEAKGQYIVITHEDANGNPAVSIIDENDESGNSIKPAQIIPLLTTEIRTINMSSLPISVEMRDGAIIDPVVSPLSIDNYETIGACKSAALDSIDIKYSDKVKSSLFTSLDVLSRYSIVVFDSADVKAGGSLLIEPLKLNVEVKGKAVVRVVNTLGENEGLNVSIGARNESDKVAHVNGFSSGIALARRLQFGDISKPVIVTPGPAPLSVFTASEPSRLLFTANTNLDADKSYIILISYDDMGSIKLTAIEEDEQNKSVDYLKQGVFFQLVNAMSDNSPIKVNINSANAAITVLDKAVVNITNSLATVIDYGSQTIFVNGVAHEINANVDERVIMVVGGTSNNLQVISNKSTPLTKEQNDIWRLRFVNATTDIDATMLKKSDKDSVFVEGVERNAFSSYTTEIREQKPTYFFYEGELKGYLARFSDVTLSLGKSYCVILYGTSARDCVKKYDTDWKLAPTCYSIIIQQEF